ncbi:MAG: NAD(P)-dependent oxidoreductase [Chloroflexota bacterium]|nr:NAD(P)-dependent oxidoreductase [Chloroflexota bacterium]MDE2885265.1 NAD(P)-dependent oxidoreductase [Chloroflexota bacterium]
MTSLITGAGLVGTSYAREAVAQGDPVVFYDVRPDADYINVKLDGGPYEAVQGDLRDLPALVTAMQQHRPEVVVHTAGLIGNSVGSPVYTGMQINVQGTINVLEAARLTGVKRFIHVSTYGVYDRRAEAGGTISESYQRAGGGNPYSASKVANEHIAEAYATYYGFELVFVRPSNVFGYNHFRGGSGGGMTVHSVVEAGFTGQPLVVPAIRGRAFEYVYGKDLGRLIRRAAGIPISGVTAFNGGNGYITTFEELVEAVRAVFPDLDVTVAPPDRPIPDANAPLDISNAKALLDWQPEYSVQEAFADYVEEMRRAEGR